MIRYSLRCEQEHDFEAWFASSGAYDAQVDQGLVTCPVCGSPKVAKALMAPAVATSERAEPAPPPVSPASAEVVMLTEKERRLRDMIRQVRAEVMKHAEDVGPGFASEARKMHYGEADPRPIHGQATLEDAREMAEEGIEFLPLPSLPDEGN